MARRKPARRGPWILATALKLLAIATLPAVFVRAAVELYGSGSSTIFSIAGAAGVVLVALTLLVAAISRRLTGRAPFWTLMRWVALPAVILWSGYSLFHLAQANAKTAGVKSTYTSLHPVLRLAVSSAIVADGELVVTDAKRTAADYRRMGLPVFERTMHYPQRDTWVHAIDVRTVGHSELRNVMLAWYFRTVGLRVVRHIGTADHLHVELPMAPAAR
jgi:hypothetical protein